MIFLLLCTVNVCFLALLLLLSLPSMVVTLIYKARPTSNYRMIAFSSSIGKTFHLMLASSIQSFRLSNKLIHPSLQKAFLTSINCCYEHCSVLNFLSCHTCIHKKTLHCTWFNPANAFGSISHSLIFPTLLRNEFPPDI